MVAVRLISEMVPVYFVSVYISPNKKISLNDFLDLLSSIPDDGQLVLTGDFNAHFPCFILYTINDNARALIQLQEIRNLVLVNNGEPTFGVSLMRKSTRGYPRSNHSLIHWISIHYLRNLLSNVLKRRERLSLVLNRGFPR